METERISKDSSRVRMAALRGEIEGGRAGCAGPQGRMPERLWRDAVRLACELGVERVASALALSAEALPRRAGDMARAEPALPAFLDLTRCFSAALEPLVSAPLPN